MLTADDKALRRKGIGGSEVAACLGVAKWSTPMEVWAKKTGAVTDDDIGSLPAELGHYMEPKIADIYQRNNGGKFACPLIGPFSTRQHPDRKWQIYSPDRLRIKSGKTLPVIQDCIPQNEDIELLVEIKTANARMRQEWGDPGTEAIPFEYYCQVAWYMSALDVDSADVAVIFGGSEYAQFHVARDRAFEDKLLVKVEDWWKKYVVGNEPPPPTGHLRDSSILKQRWKDLDGEIVASNERLNDTAASLRSVTKSIESLEKLRRLYVQELQAAIQDHAGIETSEGVITWKANGRGNISYKSLCDDLANRLGMHVSDLRKLADEHRSDPARVFRAPREWARKEQ